LDAGREIRFEENILQTLRQVPSGESCTLISVLSFIAGVYLRFVGLTSRIVWLRRPIRNDLEASGKGFIYGFWHARQAFLTYLHARDRIHPLISQSKDGEIIAKVCRHFGLIPVRGSSSRGGMEATRELMRWVESGERVGLTPDGPRGPREQVQDGILYLAQKTGAPIVPVAYGARRYWMFKSWDAFILPKPFNVIAIAYGDPLRIGPGDDLVAQAATLKDALDRVTKEADRAVQGAARA
jgi:lysophospholipid acyltransferase (LPLAT)-like uncharacterized protein